MSWEAIGATAELLAAIGVLVSLVYLAVQVRQNTAWLRQQAFQLGTNEVRRWSSHFSESTPLSELFIRGQKDFASLEPAERLQFTMLIFEICSVWATYQEHNQEDLLGLRQSAEHSIATWIRQGWFERWFESNSHMFSPNFKIFAQRLIDSAGTGES
jgi:hypothetical protein